MNEPNLSATNLSETRHAQAIEQVVRSVARARELLITATIENLNRCEAELVTALNALQDLHHQLQACKGDEAAGLRTSAQWIKKQVSDFTALLHQARDFHAGWSGLLEANLAGYTASGAPAQLDRPRMRIAMEG